MTCHPRPPHPQTFPSTVCCLSPPSRSLRGASATWLRQRGLAPVLRRCRTERVRDFADHSFVEMFPSDGKSPRARSRSFDFTRCLCGRARHPVVNCSCAILTITSLRKFTFSLCVLPGFGSVVGPGLWASVKPSETLLGRMGHMCPSLPQQ